MRTKSSIHLMTTGLTLALGQAHGSPSGTKLAIAAQLKR